MQQHSPHKQHVRRLSCADEGSSSSQWSSQDTPNKPKRTVVYNACEHCRISKSKCSGKAPCRRCLKTGVECKFTGRALDRATYSLEQSRSELADSQGQLATAQQDLVTSQNNLNISQNDLRYSQQQLFAVEQDLHVSRQLVASLRQQVADSQRDLTTSQLDLLISQQQGRNQAYLLDDIFRRLKESDSSLNPDLKEIASQSRDASDFMEKISALPDDVKHSIGSSLPWDIIPYEHPSRRNVPGLPLSPPSLDEQVETGQQFDSMVQDDHQAAQPLHAGGWQSQVDNALSTMSPADDGVQFDGLQHFSFLSPDYNNRNQP